MLTATVGAATTTNVAVGGLTGERREARIGSESVFGYCGQMFRRLRARCKEQCLKMQGWVKNTDSDSDSELALACLHTLKDER
jgi:hypothetical protein